MHGTIAAYNQQNHLRISLENVGFAIKSQPWFYVNFHAEDLRTMFVAYASKRDLTGHLQISNRDTVHCGIFFSNVDSVVERIDFDPGIIAVIVFSQRYSRTISLLPLFRWESRRNTSTSLHDNVLGEIGR